MNLLINQAEVNSSEADYKRVASYNIHSSRTIGVAARDEVTAELFS